MHDIGVKFFNVPAPAHATTLKDTVVKAMNLIIVEAL